MKNKTIESQLVFEYVGEVTDTQIDNRMKIIDVDWGYKEFKKTFQEVFKDYKNNNMEVAV